MGGYITNRLFGDISSNKCFSQENFKEWETNIEDLDRIQIGTSLHEISQDNLDKLYTRIFLKRKSLNLRLYGELEQDLSSLSKFTELENLSIEVSNHISNIEILENFKNLKSLHLVFDNQENLDFLWKINPSLEKLTIATNIKKKTNLDLMPISRFKNLTYLYLKEYNKNIDTAILELSKIETLVLRSISKPKDLEFISHLTELKDLIIQLGSFEDISSIAKLSNIRHLQLWRLLKLKDLNVVSHMNNLQNLSLEALNGVEKFPEISNLSKLKRIMIVSCKNLIDFSSIEKSKSLTHFIIQNAKNSDINEFVPILKNPNIKDLGIGYQKVSTQKELENLAKEYNKTIETYMYPRFGNEMEYE